MNRHAALVAPVVLAFTVAACSSSTNGTGSASTKAGGPSSSSAASSSPTAAAPNKTKLASFLLTQADVPDGWKGAPSEKSGGADRAKVAACLGIPDSSTKPVAEADSDDYTKDNSSISSSARSFASQTIIDDDIQGPTSSKASDCFKLVLLSSAGDELPSGALITKLDVTVSPGSNGGPSNVVALVRANAVVAISGQEIPLYIAAWYMKGNLVEADVDFIGVAQEIDSAAQMKAVTAVAQRIAAG